MMKGDRITITNNTNTLLHKQYTTHNRTQHNTHHNITKTLDIDPNDTKGSFRKGQALAGLKEWSDALKVLQTAAKSDPQNKAIRNEIAKYVIIFCRHVCC